MTTDPIVQEVRKIRHEIERECQHDSEQYYQRLKALQNRLAGRCVCRRPKLMVTAEKKRVI